MRNDLIEELKNGYDNEPESLPREAERMASLMEEAAAELQRFAYLDDDPYKVLSKINVNNHIEKKNGLSYLSWAWAWDTFMGLYPESFTKINRPENGLPYWTDGKTCWVDVSVVLVWNGHARSRDEVFPIMDYKNNSIMDYKNNSIMDYKNNSIPLEKLTSFNVNTALQRAWTKCIARHGLGFYIYAGEDLPKEEAEAKKAETAMVTSEQAEKIYSLYSTEEIQTMLKRLKKGSIGEITWEQAEKMIAKRDRSLVNDQTETF